MPKETAAQRRARFTREDYAAMRAAITPAMREEAQAADKDTEYPAGYVFHLRAGSRRIEVDEGKLRALALHDAIKARGEVEVIGYRMGFGIAGGRGSLGYGISYAGRGLR